MMRLILTADESGAGCLLRAGIADIVTPLGFRLVWGPLPSDATLDARLGPASLEHFPQGRLGEFRSKGMGLLDLCEHCETIGLWFDPVPNAQLMLAQLLNCFSSRPSIVSKLSLFQADVVIGDQPPERLSEWRPRGVKIRSRHLSAASRTWQAYRQPTPEHWFSLLGKDLSPLPQFGRTVLELLEELPGRTTGIGATELRMLELIFPGEISPYQVFPGHRSSNTRRTFEYWEAGSLLDGLARCPAPAVSGLEEGPFTEEMRSNAGRHARYKQSKLSLSGLGRAVLAQTEDFSAHNPMHRWWGGTELTNDSLWRWDPTSRRLIAP